MNHRPSRLALLLVVAACAAESRPTASPLDLPGPVFIAAAGDTVAMVETARFGVLDGDPDYMLSNVNWILPSADGGVILFDWATGRDASSVRAYDSTGQFVRRIGRPGDGPGEFRTPTGTILPDGSLVLQEQGPPRLTLYTRDGAFIRSWRGPRGMVDVGPTSGGGIWVAAVTGHSEAGARPIAYWRYDTTGAPTDSVEAPAHYRDGPWNGIGGFEPSAMVIILPDGRFVTSRTDSIAFLVHESTGPRRVEVPFSSPRYHAEERAAMLAAHEESVRRTGQDPRSPDYVVPEVKQAYRYMITDPAGHILFLRRTASWFDSTAVLSDARRTPWRGRLSVEVFDSSTTHLGRLEAPPGVLGNRIAFTENAVWLVHEGESGEHILVRWVPERRVW